MVVESLGRRLFTSSRASSPPRLTDSSGRSHLSEEFLLDPPLSLYRLFKDQPE